MNRRILLMLCLAGALYSSPLQIGDDAPLFVLKDQEGFTHNLISHKGSFVLLFFYQRDFTLSAQRKMRTMEKVVKDSFNEKLIVYGISNDKVENHRKFYDKMHISFDLLADEGGEVIKAYKANAFMQTRPYVILIGPDGRLFRTYDTMQKFLYSSNLVKSIINGSI